MSTKFKATYHDDAKGARSLLVFAVSARSVRGALEDIGQATAHPATKAATASARVQLGRGCHGNVAAILATRMAVVVGRVEEDGRLAQIEGETMRRRLRYFAVARVAARYRYGLGLEGAVLGDGVLERHLGLFGRALFGFVRVHGRHVVLAGRELLVLVVEQQLRL